jgi:acyl-CoA synthetase (AMP-forming)/AMP-acid ligase II
MLRPEAAAIARGKQVIASYAQLGQLARRLSEGLTHKLALAPGDRVAIVAANCPEYMVILFACWHAGLAVVPVNAKLHPQELEYIFTNSESNVVFCSGPLDAKGVEVIEIGSQAYNGLFLTGDGYMRQVGAGDPAWLFYTSGTTGRPKGAVLSHANLLHMCMAYFTDIDSVGVGDSIVHAAPLSHGSGLYALPHFAGGSLQVIPESNHFDVDELFALVRHHSNVSFFAAPTMLTRALSTGGLHDVDVTRIRTIIYGGAAMHLADTERAIQFFGPRLFNLYGQGESPMTIAGLPQSEHANSANPRYRERLMSCGVPRSGVEVRVVDADKRELPPGEVGEILTRSACVMRGYFGNPEATAHALKGGWLHTGDLGTFDADGFLTIQDRSKDLIISGGSNIYPREVEEVLLRAPGVLECAVVGRPHPDWGEEVVALVVRRLGASVTTRELDTLCLESIARFKRPKAYVFLDALPKNSYGKILKTELRKLLEVGNSALAVPCIDEGTNELQRSIIANS